MIEPISDEALADFREAVNDGDRTLFVQATAPAVLVRLYIAEAEYDALARRVAALTEALGTIARSHTDDGVCRWCGVPNWGESPDCPTAIARATLLAEGWPA